VTAPVTTRSDAATDAPITQRSALSLARSIRARGLTARDVVGAHVELARRVNPRVNAIVAERFDAALADADAADARIDAAAADEGLPPLLGVPCTMKESIAVEGMPNSAGLVARADYRATRTAPVAKRLLDAGAILLGLTNTSELTMWIESDNRLYGRTNNAYDDARIAGGSSAARAARSVAASRRSASARTSVARSGSRPSATACSATSRRSGWCR